MRWPIPVAAACLALAMAACSTHTPADVRSAAGRAAVRAPATERDAMETLSRQAKHFYERMDSSDDSVRLRLLTEVTYFNPRDSVNYPPYFRALLRDAHPRLRWEGLYRLWEHNIVLEPKDVPESFMTPLTGMVWPRKGESIEPLRKRAAGSGAEAGWALAALGIVGDPAATTLALILLDDSNVFARYSAAVVLLRRGDDSGRSCGETALRQLTKDTSDPSSYYRVCAAEALVRAGHREYIGTLIEIWESGARSGYADGPDALLEDLTGVYFPDAGACRKWWRGNSAALSVPHGPSAWAGNSGTPRRRP